MRRFAAVISAALILGSSVTASASEPVVVNTTMRSTLSPSNPNVVRIDDRYAEIYRFEVRRGDCVEFVMRSDEVDSVIKIQIDGGYVIAEDDDSGGGRDALVRGTVRYTGPVYLVATTAQPDETGRYSLAAHTCDGDPLPGPRQPSMPASPPSSSPSRRGSTYPMM